MANELVLQVDAGTLASGFCPATYQEMLNGFSARQTVTFPDTFRGVDVSATAPADTTKVWLKLDSLGRPTFEYLFAQGAWLSMHQQVPGTIIMWDQALPNFATFDGGDANAPSTMSGPMWEEVSALRARVPIGAGTLSPSGTILAVTNTGGAEAAAVTLALPNIPPHTHPCTGTTGGESGSGFNFFDGDQGGSATPSNPLDLNTQSAGGTAGAAVPVSIPTLPPYYTVYFLRRTSRLFRVG